MTTITIFPDKTQWTIRTWVKYLWMKLLRKNVRVCSGTDDNKTLQEAADYVKEGVIALEDGEYHVGNLRGTAPSARILDGGAQMGERVENPIEKAMEAAKEALMKCADSPG